MAIFNGGFLRGGQQRDGPDRLGLEKNGPIMSVEIVVPFSLAKHLRGKKIAVPAPIKGLALIDSGASTSCVDSQVIGRLGVKPIGVGIALTAGGACEQNLYPARFNFPEGKLSFEFSSVMGVDLKEQTIMGRKLVALVGRDVLSECVFVYNGLQASYTFAL